MCMATESTEKQLYSNTAEVAAVGAVLLIRKSNLGPLNRFSFMYKRSRLQQYVQAKGKESEQFSMSVHSV